MYQFFSFFSCAKRWVTKSITHYLAQLVLGGNWIVEAVHTEEMIGKLVTALLN